MAIKTMDLQCPNPSQGIELTNDILTKIGKSSRVVNAILMPTVQGISSQAEQYAIKVSYNEQEAQIIDYIKPTVNNRFSVNITEELICKINNEAENIRIIIDSGLTINNTVMLAVEYVSEHLMTDDVASCDVDAHRAGSGKVNLATGKLRFNHDLGAGLSLTYNDSQANEVSTKIASENNSETTFKHSCGKGWKLNVEQYLVKTVNADNKEIYTYVDAQGNYHEFYEKYYYLNGEQKTYINKEEIITDLNGKLTYSKTITKRVRTGTSKTITITKIYDAFVELKSTSGLTLNVDYSKFNGGKFLELRQNEQIELEENVEAYANQLKEYVVVNKVNGESVESDSLKTCFVNGKLAVKDYENFISKTETADKLLFTQSEAIQYNSLLLQQSNKHDNIGKTVSPCTFNNSEDYSDAKLKDIKFTKGNYSVSLYDMQRFVKDLRADLSTLTKKSDYSAPNRQLNYQYDEYMVFVKKMNLTNDAKVYEDNSINNIEGPSYDYGSTPDVNDDFECGTNTSVAMSPCIDSSEHLIDGYCDLQAEIAKLTQKTDQERYFTAFQKEFNNRVEKLQLNIAKFEKEISNYMELEQGKLIDKQITMLLERSEVNKIELEKYFKQYINKQRELDTLYMQFPVSYITTSDGMTMGFNKYGQFVAMFDAYENQTVIIYEKGKIVRIQDSNEKVITLEYDEDLLTKIIFTDDTSVSLEYSNQLLNAIFDREETTSFDYNSASYLANVSHSYGRGVQFVRDEYNRIKSVNETSTLNCVSDNSVENASEESNLLASFNYHESHLTTTVTDKHDISKTYLMDIMGKPVTVYEGEFYDPEKTTKSLSLEYVDNKQTFAVSQNISVPNILTEDLESQTLVGNIDDVRQRVFDVDVSKLTASCYVFSVWAKADSAYIPHVRNSLYGNHDFDKEFGINVDAIKAKRKFELRAEYTYSDGTSDSVSAAYDWLNTGWQFVALPIQIKKTNGNTLPTEFPFGFDEEGKAVTGLKLIVDYSYNTGDFDYDCCSLRQGDWTKKEFNAAGNVIKSEDSSSKSVITYEYDKDDKLIAEELTDYKDRTYATKYEYNKQGNLVRTISFDGTVKETVFDEKGRVLRKITYNQDDPTSKFYEESKRDDKGVITADVDESGEYDTTTYTYDHNGEATVHTDGKGNKTAFGYKDGNMVSISGASNGEESTNTMNYTVGLLTKVSCGDTDYNYSYDKWGRTTKVEIAGATYAANEVSDNDLINTTVLASGDKFVSETNKYGNTVIQSATYNNGIQEKVVNEYNPETSRLSKTTVDINGVKAYNIEYNYDEADGKLLSSVRSGEYALTKENKYTGDREVESTTYTVAEQALTYTYETDNTPEKRNSKVQLPFDVEQKFAYDGLGRTKEISLSENLVKDIYYAKYGDHATNRINSVWHGVNGIRKDNTRYTYDKAGNIETVRENGKLVAKYTYDGLNRLVREDNVRFGTFTYQYDTAGNILSKTEYAYTLAERLEQEVSVKEYSYNQHGWKDQLQSFNGEQFSYDVIGNPIVYRNRTLSWQGRRLLRYGNDRYYAEYTYDVNGIRTSKHAVTPIGTVDSKYIYDGNNLIAEQRNGTWIYYIYGIDGVVGFNYQGNIYLYRKNVQGDVTHIYKQLPDNTLEQVAQYVYDAWGNTQILQDTDGIATLNPFRYRSYYFDEETGLYYLQTRYYDTELGRFISADSIEYLDPETLGGLNLYAYCGNNPVMGIDPEGTWDWGHFWKIVAAAAIVVAVTALTVVTAGAAAVALGVSATAVMVTTAVCGVVGGVAEIVGQCVNNGIDNLNLWDVAVETFTNAAYGGAAAIGAGTGSLVIKMATRGVIVGLSGLNTYMHDIYKVKNLEMTQEELQKDVARSLLGASIIQLVMVSFGKSNASAGGGGLPKWLKQIAPVLITTVKSVYRQSKEEINKIGIEIGKVILWTLFKKYLKPRWKHFIA